MCLLPYGFSDCGPVLSIPLILHRTPPSPLRMPRTASVSWPLSAKYLLRHRESPTPVSLVHVVSPSHPRFIGTCSPSHPCFIGACIRPSHPCFIGACSQSISPRFIGACSPSRPVSLVHVVHITPVSLVNVGSISPPFHWCM